MLKILKKTKIHICLAQMGSFLLAILITLSCSDKKETETVVPKPPKKIITQADLEQIQLAEQRIKEAYKYKSTGHNGDALAIFEPSCALLKKHAGPTSAEYGSCLDDLASIQLRMGETQKALDNFHTAFNLLKHSTQIDPRIVLGIGKRIQLIDQLKQAGVICKENIEPDTTSPLPYFPSTEKMQQAIGKLNNKIAVCKKGKPTGIVIRTIISGSGVVINTEIAGPASMVKSDIGQCVIKKLKEHSAQANLPKFQACFRVFNYPFVVGDIPKTKGEK